MITVSRPNTVMNHGIPAAKSGRRYSPVRMRSAARSAIERSNARRRLSQPPRTRGTRSVQAATTSPSVSRSSSRCSTESRLGASSSAGRTSTFRSQRSCGSSERSNATAPPSTLARLRENDPRAQLARRGPRSAIWLPRLVVASPAPAAAARGACSGSPSAKSCCLTEMMSAKSAASSSESSKSSALHALVPDRDPLLHARSPTKRSRAIESASCGRPFTRRVAEVERGGEVLDPARREQQRPRPVDAQHEPREEARVVREEPARLGGDVAALVADAERRSFEDRQHGTSNPPGGRSSRRSTARAP